MTPDQLVVYLQTLQKEIKKGIASDVAIAMARVYRAHLVNITLREASHPLGTWTDAAPGRPPAWVTGELARSITAVRGPSTINTGTATVAPHVIYARIQEFGGTVFHKRARWLFWMDTGKGFFEKVVHLPPRPYMRPAVHDVIADGSLSRVAMETFEAEVWGA